MKPNFPFVSMEGLNALTHFWVPLKLHPPPGTAEPPNWAENPGGGNKGAPSPCSVLLLVPLTW